MPRTVVTKEYLELLLSRYYRLANNFSWGQNSVEFNHDGCLEGIDVVSLRDSNEAMLQQINMLSAVVANQNAIIMEAING